MGIVVVVVVVEGLGLSVRHKIQGTIENLGHRRRERGQAAYNTVLKYV